MLVETLKSLLANHDQKVIGLQQQVASLQNELTAEKTKSTTLQAEYDAMNAVLNPPATQAATEPAPVT